MIETQKNQITKLQKIAAQKATTKTIITQMVDYIISDKKEAENLISWMENNQFFSSPASTCFHGSYAGGLADHSLKVLTQALTFAIPVLENYEMANNINAIQISIEDIFIACIAHDFCKAGLYKMESRKVKNEEGKWVLSDYYAINYSNRNLGHGNESVLRLLEAMPSLIKRRSVLEAISRHMGAFDLSPTEERNYSIQLKNPLIILIQLADQTAAAWYDC